MVTGMTINVAVIGAGSWGTTVAHLAAHNAPTTVWARRADVVDDINANHLNSRYLPDRPLHQDLRASTDLAATVAAADLLVMGVPSHGFRDTLEQVQPHLRPWVPVLSLAKGLEPRTQRFFEGGAMDTNAVDWRLEVRPAR